MDRIILHADLNSFFASVELLSRPDLRSVPMAVAGDAEQRRGIILAKNELAKACGVKTAETIWQARKKCPGLQLVPPDHLKYQHYSELARELFCRLTDRVESFGLDEAWMDVTGSTSLFGDGRAMADWLRQQMKDELGLTCSVGVSFTKVFAKLGSDMKKPDATTVISRDNYQQLVWPLPVSQLLFVGAVTERRLRQVGIKTIGDLARCEQSLLKQWLGRHGPELWLEANGRGDDQVAFSNEHHAVKSIGNSTTTAHDLTDNEMVKLVIYQLSDQVASRLRAEKMKARTIQITIRDNQFRTIDRQMQLPRASDLAAEIAPLAMNLFAANYSWQHPVRNLGVRATDLESEGELQQMTLQDLLPAGPAASQPGLTGLTGQTGQTGQGRQPGAAGAPVSQDSRASRERQQQLEQTLDNLRSRFGHRLISRGSLLEKDTEKDIEKGIEKDPENSAGL